MKTATYLTLLLIATKAHSQMLPEGYKPPVTAIVKPMPANPFTKTDRAILHISNISAGAIKGIARVQNEVTTHGWLNYQYRHPETNPQWSNPKVSALNKYENRDPNAGEAFPGSTTIFVMLTDKYHLNNSIVTFMTGAQITLCATLSIDAFMRKGKFRLIDPLIFMAETMAAEILFKGLGHKFYDVY